MKLFSYLAIDSQLKNSLREIPDSLQQYEDQVFGGQDNLLMGYALRKGKARTRFTSSVRQYLIAKFEQGQRSGKKFDARKIAKTMRTEKVHSGEHMFTPDQFLTWQQIASFWSTYARTHNKRSGAVIDDPSNTIEETDNDVYMSDPNLDVQDAVIDELTDNAIEAVQTDIQ